MRERAILFEIETPGIVVMNSAASRTQHVPDGVVSPDRLVGGCVLILSFLSLFASRPVDAQIVLNEILATNVTTILDDDGDSSDWVELVNSGDSPRDLTGYALSDDPGEPRGWEFPGVSLEPGEHLVVWCSGKDRTESPPGLAGADGSGSPFDARFVSAEAEWRYLTGTPEEEGPAGDWIVPGFDDGAWEIGRPGFGFGNDEYVTTELPSGIGAVFLRHTFTIDEVPDRLILQARYDDGFVAYLNGVEVVRANYAGEGVPTFDVTAIRLHSARLQERWDLTERIDGLTVGENTLAIALFNRTSSGRDLVLLPELGIVPPVLHTDFELDSDGETVSLAGPDGSVVDSVTFGEQIRDQSYGRSPDGRGPFLYHLTPTPGEENAGITGAEPLVVADTIFSVDRGFHEEPFSVEITTATEGAEIRYTLDGSAPNADHGEIYTGSITIETTTVLRAAAFREGLRPTNVDTQTYLFLYDVIRQPTLPAGFPRTWGTREADYEVDAEVAHDPAYRDEIVGGLLSLRTLSIVVDQDDFFNNPRGIYANPRQEGPEWERPISVEFLHPGNESKDLQVDCGIRIHGNGSRNPGRQKKHGFRLEFRRIYGPKTLEFDLFPGSPVDEFDSLILRGQNAHGWSRQRQLANDVGTSEREQSQYIRDSFARDLHSSMGHVGGAATYVHLYINGLYWGLYNPVEYPRAFFGASHFGGRENEYDSINRRPSTGGTHSIDGDRESWDEMQRLAESGLGTPEKYEAIQEHMDVDNMIDYLLVHQYMGSRDGPEPNHSNNMRLIRRSRGPADVTWKCLLWDMEASLFEIDVTRNVNADDPDTIVRVYNRLRANREFLVRYGDHVHRHCFNGGSLTPERTREMWETRADEIFSAIIGESARWGDAQREAPLTRDVEWTDERNRLLTTYFPTRTDFLVDLLRRNDLYPTLDSPSFEQHGGIVPAGFLLRVMGSEESTIYYTTDGSDPRLPGGGVSGSTSVYEGPVVLEPPMVVKARSRDGITWSALNRATFQLESRIVVSEILYHPQDPPEGSPFEEADFEFVEIHNTGSAAIDVSRARFLSAIEFEFPEGTVLEPGGYLVVARRISAFETRYGSEGIRVLGDYSGRLSNGGETLALVGVFGELLFQVAYDDWFDSTDGRGHSLVPVDPRDATADWNSLESWRPSRAVDGSPGRADPGTPGVGESPFVRGDANRDGVINITDPVSVLGFLFLGRPTPTCGDSADSDDDGRIGITDAIFTLEFLFQGGSPPPPPHPAAGTDPTQDVLTCE